MGMLWEGRRTEAGVGRRRKVWFPKFVAHIEEDCPSKMFDAYGKVGWRKNTEQRGRLQMYLQAVGKKVEWCPLRYIQQALSLIHI